MRASLVCLVAGALGCGGSEEGRTVDLVELFPLAAVVAESPGFDASREETLDVLVSGWTAGGDRDGEAFVWSAGRVSRLELVVFGPRPITLRLRGWPLVYPGAPPQVVRLHVNGTMIGEIEMAPQWTPAEYEVAVPPEALISGRNFIELHYSRSDRPVEVLPGASDRRSLSAAWTSIVAQEIRAPDPVRVTSGSDRPGLEIPVGSSVELFLWLPEGGRLRGDVGARSSTDLEVDVSVAGTSNRVTARVAPGAELELDIPSSPEGPVRLAFEPVGSAGLVSAGSGLRLERPRVEVATATRGSAVQNERHRVRRRPNIVIYLVDTLRADHLGAYGYDRPTSPRIDAFARQATVFTAARAQASWTRSAVASLFTGLYPQVHGTVGREDALAEAVPTLPEMFRALGYETLGLFANTNLSVQFGFHRGFDEIRQFEENLDRPEVHELSDRVNEEAFEWLRARSTDSPFLLYVHTADPHEPYMPVDPFRAKFANAVSDPELGSLKRMSERALGRLPAGEREIDEIVSLYDAEIAFNDAQFGALLDELERLGLDDSTVVVFLSDHGEEFLEHGGWSHGATLFEEQLAIPLIVRLTEGIGEGRRLGVVARQIDVLPTLLDFMGEPIPPDLQGRSLVPLIETSVPASDGSSTFDLTEAEFAHLALDGRVIESVTVRGRKLIEDLQALQGPSGTRSALFDLRVDPAEAVNLYDAMPVWRGFLESLLRYRRVYFPAASGVERAVIDEDTRRTLEALGYLD